jgi:hypothetical protein
VHGERGSHGLKATYAVRGATFVDHIPVLHLSQLASVTEPLPYCVSPRPQFYRFPYSCIRSFWLLPLPHKLRLIRILEVEIALLPSRTLSSFLVYLYLTITPVIPSSTLPRCPALSPKTMHPSLALARSPMLSLRHPSLPQS